MSLRYADQSWLYANLLGDGSEQRRVPLSGTFEPTLRCNLDCVHCYLRGQTRNYPEMETGQVQHLLAQAAESGCLSLFITGGEPLLRTDFRTMWTSAHAQGFLLGLFTNATLVDESMADFLVQHPPRAVEISLYGASRKAYERITGQGAAFDAALRGIDALVSRDLPVLLKSVLQRDLLGEIDAMRRLAEDRKLQIRFDPGLDPCLNGDTSPIDLRLEPSESVSIEMEGEERLGKLRDYHRRWQNEGKSQGADPCGAGFRAFHLDPRGQMMPCMMMRGESFNALELGFAEAWSAMGEGPRVQYPEDSPCRTCDLQHLCSQCPAQPLMGQGPARAKDPKFYHCRVAKLRAGMLE